MELDDEPKESVDISEPELPGPIDLQTPDPKSGQGSDFVPPTHPDTEALMSIKQQSQEKVHHFWARFLLVKDKVKDCRERTQYRRSAKIARTKESLTPSITAAY